MSNFGRKGDWRDTPGGGGDGRCRERRADGLPGWWTTLEQDAAETAKSAAPDRLNVGTGFGLRMKRTTGVPERRSRSKRVRIS